ncbi:MAG: YchF/TatD family DNA exonuclease [Magnetococcales bacterium]|nr:YchF/TatD family DNA exonuclease [Magnetococcales bacterium]
MMLFDTHCHLDFPDFDQDLQEVIARAEEAHVQHMISIGTRLKAVQTMVERFAPYPNIFISVGVHPHNVNEEDVTVAQLLEATRQSKVVAIGETGLDYFYDHGDRARQQESFRRHIRAAIAADLPVIIHTRDAEEDTQRILEEEKINHCGGVLHCFTASRSFAQWAVEKGMYISFSGISTFKNADSIRETIGALPLDKLLIETDAPYLAPVPHRGTRNEPAHVVHVLETMASVRQLPVEEMARITTNNATALFRLGDERVTKKGVLAYTIGRNLYLNVTRGCTLHCAFCPKWTSPIVSSYDLTLTGNPTSEELIEAMGEISEFDEIVFCGYGEPTLRWPVVREVAQEIKRHGGTVRLNTDGLANLVFKRDITPEMAGVIDTISISLNAQSKEVYNRHCQPTIEHSYASLLDFIKCVREHVPTVVISAIEGLEGVDIQACQKIADDLGVSFRTRYLDSVG